MNSLHRSKEAFLRYLDAIRGYSPLTVQSYADALDEMLACCEAEAHQEGMRINLMPLRIKNAANTPKTVARKLSAVRSFVRYLAKEGTEVDLEGDESVKIPKSLPKPVAHDHILHVLSQTQGDEKLAILILYTMGLRISELASLRYEDITQGWCRIGGKGGKERDVPLLMEVAELIGAHRSQNPLRRYLFEAKGRKLSENSLRYMITKAFERAGFKVTPHQLRHAYATGLLNNHARIADVSQLLGHASMATTQIYTKLGNALKMDHYRQSHPLCRTSEES